MDDSKQQLNPLDLLEVPDRWSTIPDRVPQPDLDPDARLDLDDTSAQNLRPARRIAIIAAALIIGLAATAALFVAFGREGNQIAPAAQGPERIFFTSIVFPDEPGQIYSVAPDGSDVVQVTQPPASFSSVSVSPNGARMAYVSFDNKGADSEGIYVADTDGSNATEIFSSSETPQSLIELQWSPDGQSIGFIYRSIPQSDGLNSEADLGYALWVVGADGSNPHAISEDQITSFSWSPQGDQIAVTEESVDGQKSVDDIFVIASDGSGRAQLTDDGASRNPFWSPDGHQILFERGWFPSGPLVVLMNSDGSDIRDVELQGTLADGYWREPLGWSPDSSRFLVGTGDKAHHCSTVMVQSSGASEPLLEGTSWPGSEPPGPGYSPSSSGDPCAQSASWTRVG